jgi:hypothetical protein
MTRTCPVVLLCALTWPAAPFASEYRDSDVMPEVRYLVFAKDAVGFVSRPNSQLGRPEPVFRFVYDRRDARVAEVDTAQFRARFPGREPEENPRQSHSGEQHERIGRAADGSEYRSKVKYCGEGVEDERSLVVAGRSVRILARNECTSVSAVEIVGGQLWLGTAYSGESGYSEAEGIIVESAAGERELARIVLTGWVTQLRADTFSEDVWAATEFGIYRISRKFQVSANLYYHDFDPGTGQPRIAFSPSARAGNPLAVVARMLPAAEHKGFYEAARAVPVTDLERFRLYDFFMCCSFYGHRYPESLRPLLPFFVKASERDPEPAYRNLWRQAACGFGTPDVTQYCSRTK